MRDAGLFGPGSLTWRVNREGVLLLGGGAAVIFQVAHPLVAAGVSQHSRYREDPWGRLYRTLDSTTRMIFGSREVAEEASERLRSVHRRVQGETAEPGGRYAAGAAYDANDPELAMWVHATLVDTSLQVYTRYVAPLSIAERQAYYEEQKTLGELFGVPREHQPATYAEFYDYYDEMLASDRIGITDALRDVTDSVLRPPLPLVARPLVESMNLVTVGLLPERLREELELPWGAARARVFEAQRVALRVLLPALPRLVREFPPARRADRRLAA
jgi:uncharacterized protein (DUF2236 family)